MVAEAGHVRELVDAGVQSHPRRACFAHMGRHQQVAGMRLVDDRLELGPGQHRPVPAPRLERDLDHAGAELRETTHDCARLVDVAHHTCHRLAVDGDRVAAGHRQQRPCEDDARRADLLVEEHQGRVGRTDVANGCSRGVPLTFAELVDVQVDEARHERGVLQLDLPTGVHVERVLLADRDDALVADRDRAVRNQLAPVEDALGGDDQIGLIGPSPAATRRREQRDRGRRRTRPRHAATIQPERGAYRFAVRQRPKMRPPTVKPSPNVPRAKAPIAMNLRQSDSRRQRPIASSSSGESGSPRRCLRTAPPARRPR